MQSAEARRALAEYCRDRRNPALLGLGLTYGLIVAVLALFAALPGWPTFVLAFVVVGLMQYRLVLAGHEAIHRTFLHPEWLNELSGLVSSSLVGVNFHRYRHHHLQHHRAARVADDPDAYIYRPILEARPGWPRLGALVFGMVGEALQKLGHEGPALEAREGEDPATARRHTLAIAAAQLTLMVGMGLSIAWWAWPVLWLGPLGSVALLVNRIRVFVEHGHPYASAEWWRRDIGGEPISTVDIHSNPVERFFLSGFCFNYHNAHHHAPGVPHYRLLDMTRVLEAGEPGYTPALRRSYASILTAMVWGR